MKWVKDHFAAKQEEDFMKFVDQVMPYGFKVMIEEWAD